MNLTLLIHSKVPGARCFWKPPFLFCLLTSEFNRDVWHKRLNQWPIWGFVLSAINSTYDAKGWTKGRLNETSYLALNPIPATFPNMCQMSSYLHQFVPDCCISSPGLHWSMGKMIGIKEWIATLSLSSPPRVDDVNMPATFPMEQCKPDKQKVCIDPWERWLASKLAEWLADLIFVRKIQVYLHAPAVLDV